MVALGRLKRLALGAAIGTPAAAIKAWATGWLGTRTPTVSNPAETLGGILGWRLRIRVSGPGQSAVSSRPIAGQVERDRRELIDRGEVDDQRIDGGALFGAEDAIHRLWVGRVRAEAVDGFGGEGD